jgi:ferredoxin
VGKAAQPHALRRSRLSAQSRQVRPPLSAARPELRRSSVKVSIEQDKCVAAGQCVSAAPDVFDQRDEDGIVVLLTPSVPAGTDESVRHAAAVCPAQAIHIKA